MSWISMLKFFNTLGSLRLFKLQSPLKKNGVDGQVLRGFLKNMTAHGLRCIRKESTRSHVNTGSPTTPSSGYGN